jgi:hypothetical protein
MTYPFAQKVLAAAECVWRTGSPPTSNVRATLDQNRVERANGTPGNEPNLLTGILFDAKGGRMSPTHAKGTRYRITSRGHCWKGWRKPKPRANESAWLGWEDSNSGIRAQAMYLKRRGTTNCAAALISKPASGVFCFWIKPRPQ